MWRTGLPWNRSNLEQLRKDYEHDIAALSKDFLYELDEALPAEHKLPRETDGRLAYLKEKLTEMGNDDALRDKWFREIEDIETSPAVFNLRPKDEGSIRLGTKKHKGLISVRQNSFWKSSLPCSMSSQLMQKPANQAPVVLRSRLMRLTTTLSRPTWLGRKLKSAAKWWTRSLKNLTPMVLFVPAICSSEPKVAACPASNPTTSKSPETKPSVSVLRLLMAGFLWMLILVRWNFDWLLRSRKMNA